MKILFICRANAERSQMAELMFNRLSRKNKAYSAGTSPSDDEIGLPPGRTVSELMLDLGYDNTLSHKRKRLTKAMADKADRVIVMLSKDEIPKELPSYVKKRPNVEYWDVGRIPKANCLTFPPDTYYYHIRWIARIGKHIRTLVREIG
ncbi:MAG: low molecular weight phosphatase family protein [Candidatus Micrarchaeota archaeon]|nr:low molecular weight phosphatase family protein [Candidatus Micrarchaeota archaeon]